MDCCVFSHSLDILFNVIKPSECGGGGLINIANNDSHWNATVIIATQVKRRVEVDGRVEIGRVKQ